MFTELLKEIEQKQLKETINREIEYYLKEERGIPAQIEVLINNLKDKLQLEINAASTQPYNKNFITYKRGSFPTEIFGYDTTIAWVYFSFATEELKNNTKVSASTGTFRKTGPNNYRIDLVVKAVKGKIDFRATGEVLQHELLHFWESIKYGRLQKGKRLGDYGLFLKDSPNEYYKYIGDILYLSRKFEQRAYANGLYQYLMSCDAKLLYWENLEDTQLYKALGNIKFAVAKLKERELDHNEYPLTRGIESLLKTKFGLNFQQVIAIGENAVNNITKIIGRTLSKVKDDLDRIYGLNNPEY